MCRSLSLQELRAKSRERRSCGFGTVPFRNRVAGCVGFCRPAGALLFHAPYPQLALWAALLRRSAAETRLGALRYSQRSTVQFLN
jgi:hypothetical protein